jgi:hypothetical protein
MWTCALLSVLFKLCDGSGALSILRDAAGNIPIRRKIRAPAATVSVTVAEAVVEADRTYRQDGKKQDHAA